MKSILLKIIGLFGLFSLFNRYTKNKAAVFMLHHIEPGDSENGESLSTGLLRRFLEYLRRHNYRVLSLSEYIKTLQNKESVYKTAVFTVDDGYRDFYLNAYPVFREFGYPAAIFLTGDFIEKRIFLWWDTIEYVIKETAVEEIRLDGMAGESISLQSAGQKLAAISRVINYCKQLNNSEKLGLVVELVQKSKVEISDQPRGIYAPLSWEEIMEMKENGIEFYPHTMTHPILAKIPPEEQRREITESKGILEKKLNFDPDIFCYPNGGYDDFDENTIGILKDAGFAAAVIGVAGFYDTTAENDMFRIPRFGIPHNMTWFKQYVSGLEAFKYKISK